MRWCPLLLATALVAAPALGVGLGPLKKEGVTDGDAKGFWLTVSNSGRGVETFILTARSTFDEGEQPRVVIVPDRIQIAPQRSRRVLVIARLLGPGERYEFRVCAEGPPNPKETIHARVCSKLAARRLAVAR